MSQLLEKVLKAHPDFLNVEFIPSPDFPAGNLTLSNTSNLLDFVLNGKVLGTSPFENGKIAYANSQSNFRMTGQGTTNCTLTVSAKDIYVDMTNPAARLSLENAFATDGFARFFLADDQSIIGLSDGTAGASISAIALSAMF